MHKLEKSERKLSKKEKWMLIGVAMLAIIFALLVSSFLRGLFINPDI